MPQLSLYIDQDTLKKIELAAKKEKVSISQWVKGKLQSSFEKKWPENFFQLYGSIEDNSFNKPESLDFKNDNKREAF
ncbi:toxin-antitoxin system, antitoxin component [Leptospira bandrabouensis]|uniref:Toxin-antitoxin system, antitoxin component n=1 Tax=Leptospira bandrabouensis TaxID=2484903 RepID=A0A6H3NSS0_9LEPT|nr:toxin-antitoxin system, antitoxin component [Leptospira bandrabouensis]MCG6146531.1 toxin-antitoxin system, antitoxin component [Leptospira bandrabouensis]MCG6153123.1 toxin-antitoxin system, antitoxin component [Leptospira bandrabouensis]MCG6161904.1 toxin-antitoxin system, antitoxin component [Leptospira bandrabouensis]MCG6166131.1 toxin-antitoxin system, antitoxin component [Leptospira bandrabouensis]MCW7479389.1 toxin-antitoxin system, antitoxin component [Leptospira bandrabouensis]